MPYIMYRRHPEFRDTVRDKDNSLTLRLLDLNSLAFYTKGFYVEASYYVEGKTSVDKTTNLNSPFSSCSRASRILVFERRPTIDGQLIHQSSHTISYLVVVFVVFVVATHSSESKGQPRPKQSTTVHCETSFAVQQKVRKEKMKLVSSVAFAVFLAASSTTNTEAFGPAVPILPTAFGSSGSVAQSSSSSSPSTLSMRIGGSDLGRKQRILEVIDANPTAETVQSQLLSESTSATIQQCNWKLRKTLIRKVKHQASRYDLDVPSNFGVP